MRLAEFVRRRAAAVKVCRAIEHQRLVDVV
jgi:hypothetical protein